MSAAGDLVRRRRRHAQALGKRPPPRASDPEGAPRPSTWIERARAALAIGDKWEALRICAAHVKHGEDGRSITKAWEARQRPAFQRQLGLDPDQLIAAGLVAMHRRLDQL